MNVDGRELRSAGDVLGFAFGGSFFCAAGKGNAAAQGNDFSDLSGGDAGDGGIPRLTSVDVCAASTAELEPAACKQRRLSDQEPSSTAQNFSDLPGAGSRPNAAARALPRAPGMVLEVRQ